MKNLPATRSLNIVFDEFTKNFIEESGGNAEF